MSEILWNDDDKIFIHDFQSSSKVDNLRETGWNLIGFILRCSVENDRCELVILEKNKQAFMVDRAFKFYPLNATWSLFAGNSVLRQSSQLNNLVSKALSCSTKNEWRKAMDKLNLDVKEYECEIIYGGGWFVSCDNKEAYFTDIYDGVKADTFITKLNIYDNIYETLLHQRNHIDYFIELAIKIEAAEKTEVVMSELFRNGQGKAPIGMTSEEADEWVSKSKAKTKDRGLTRS